MHEVSTRAFTLLLLSYEPTSVRVPGAQEVVIQNPASIRISVSGRRAFRQRATMSGIPVPILSMYFVRYMGSATSGLAGTEA